MGYPGKPTDDVMDLVRKLRELAFEAGGWATCGDSAEVERRETELDVLMDEIHSQVHAMDTSEDEYAASMGGG